MKKWTKSSEEFAKKHGWKLVKGYYIDLEAMRDLSDDWDKCYFEEEDFDDFVFKCEYWKHEDIENVYEDIDDLIESEYEEYFDDNGELYDEPVNEA